MEQTTRPQRGGLEEISQTTYMHICKAHGHRQLCGEGRGWGCWVEASKGENGGHL